MCKDCHCDKRVFDDCTGFDASKCTRVLAASYFLGTAALVMICASFAFIGWFVTPLYDSSFTNIIGNIWCGLTDFKIVRWADGVNPEVTTTGKLEDIGSYLIVHGNAFERLASGGRKVYALCIPALILFIGGFTSVGIYRFNKTPVSFWYALVGLLAYVLALIFVVLAVILFDGSVYVGNSYLVFLTAGLMGVLAFMAQLSVALVRVTDSAKPVGWWRPAIAVAFNVIALVMACAGLATLQWLSIPSDDGDYTLNVGLKKWEYVRNEDGRVTDSGDTSDLNTSYSQYRGFNEAGNYALGFGIPGIFAALAAAVLGAWAATGKPSWHLPSFVCTAISAGFLLMGVFFYGRTIFMGWTFSMFTVTPFILLVSLVLMLVVLLGDNNKNAAAPSAEAMAAARAANGRANSLNADITSQGGSAPVHEGMSGGSAYSAKAVSSPADPYAPPVADAHASNPQFAAVTVNETPAIPANPFGD